MKTLKSKFSLKVKIPINEPTKYPLSAVVPNNEISHIIDNVYISGYKSSINYSFLIQNNFTHIINCAGGSKSFIPLQFDDFKYFKINLKDDGNVNIIDAIVQFIHLLKDINSSEGDKKILIHCTEGISRAPTLVCAYLMWRYGMDSKDAINFVKERRKCIDINLGFMFQLEDLSLHKDILRAI